LDQINFKSSPKLLNNTNKSFIPLVFGLLIVDVETGIIIITSRRSFRV